MFGYAQVNDTQLYYEIKGEGEPLVLIHSGYTDLRIWDDQVEFFSPHNKVIRYDLRGFGKSMTPTKSFSHVKDLYCLLKHLHIEQITLLGVSKGGSIAVDFTLEYPHVVKKLILSGAALNGYQFEQDEASKKRLNAGISLVKRDANLMESVEYLLHDPMWRQNNFHTKERLRTMFMETSLKWILDTPEEQLEVPAVNRLSEIRIPAMIIVGENDSLPILEISMFYQKNIKDAKRVLIKGTGHLPNMDKPAEFNKNVLEFLIE